MPDKEILIVEDEELTLNILTKMITSLGYTVVSATNGKEALELFKEKSFLVVLTDIGMPLIDGNELISRLNRIEMKPLILVQTGHSDVSQVIDTMRRGVFDYIIKPVEIADIQFKLERAFSMAEIIRGSYIVQKEKTLRLEQQLEWLKWNEGIINRDYERMDRALFKNLHTSFNQGAGFGTLLTLLQLISNSAVKQENGWLIDGELFSAVQESSKIALNTINIFSEINNILSKDFKLEEMTISEVHTFISEKIQNLQKYLDIRGNSISMSDAKPDFNEKKTKIDTSYFGKALHELLINAMKFSKQSSKIILILDCQNDDMDISILNEPDANDRDVVGIPMEYSTIIFEPFFRIVSNVYERFDTIDYGLGLTLVQKIIERLDGKISAFNIQDNSNLSRGAITKVTFSLSIPLVQ